GGAGGRPRDFREPRVQALSIVGCRAGGGGDTLGKGTLRRVENKLLHGNAITHRCGGSEIRITLSARPRRAPLYPRRTRFNELLVPLEPEGRKRGGRKSVGPSGRGHWGRPPSGRRPRSSGGAGPGPAGPRQRPAARQRDRGPQPRPFVPGRESPAVQVGDRLC